MKFKSRHLPATLSATIFLFCMTCLTWGCGHEYLSRDEDEVISVVVTLSFFEDMVGRVGGEAVEVKALVPVGVEPEDYDPTPADIRAVKDADIVIYNGHNMERWLPRVISDLEGREGYYALAEDPFLETIPLPSGPFEGDPDPHLWTDVKNAVSYVERISSILAEHYPEAEELFRENAESYIKDLNNLDRWIREEVEKIPPENRILITSELCFQYFAASYGFFHDAIWPINAPEEGTPSQIIRVVELVKEKRPPAVFVENQVDHRPMEQVSRETGVPLGGVLFSDSLSKPGEGGETYIKMMESNVRRITAALAGEEGR